MGGSPLHRRASESAGRNADAIATVQGFHDKLRETRVLDPACGTGNFLYIALLLMKKLEDEVLEAIVDLGGQEALTGLAGHSVDPHQFLGLELNPRAAAIAELVLWIGHLQWHIRSKGGVPGEPILRAFHNIQVMDAVLAADAPCADDPYPNPRRPDWPQAHFIVGNPPFIGGKDLRARLSPEKARALRAAHPAVNESADLVMYWWDRAADILLPGAPSCAASVSSRPTRSARSSSAASRSATSARGVRCRSSWQSPIIPGPGEGAATARPSASR